MADRLAHQDKMAKLLFDTWIMYPELELGQLVQNAGYFDIDGNVKSFSPPAVMLTDAELETGLVGLQKRFAREEIDK